MVHFNCIIRISPKHLRRASTRFSSLLVVAILLFPFLSGCDRPIPTGTDLDKIDTSRDPIQKTCTSEKPIVKEFKSGRFRMVPLAEYEISGVVVGTETYSSDWDGQIAPIDLAVVWGKLTEPESNKYIAYSQSGRWYHYRWKEGSPVENSYILSHSSNSHIIPANENIRRAVKALRRKDRVLLKGFLVNLKGAPNGQTVTWNTSLSRTDTGNGSCELFYVCYVKIDTKVYE